MQYIFSIFCLFVLIPLAIAGYSMAPWVPTRKKDIQRLLKILEIKKGDHFLEIGCGDGRVSRAVADSFQSAQIHGIELAFPMYIIAKMRNIFGPKNLHLKLANAFKQDFGKYDVIYVYGMPDKMGEKIIPKFLKEAKNGAKLYSYVFSITTPPNLPLPRGGIVSHGGEEEAKIHVITKS